MIDAIVFDFDGVLAESVNVKGEAFVALYAKESENIHAQVLAYHRAHGGVSRFDKIKYYEQELLGRDVTEESVLALANRFSKLVEDKVVQSAWVTGARRFLEEHIQDLPLYLASATPQEELHRIVEKRGMTRYFKHIGGTPKKKHEHIQDVLNHHQCAPDKVVMIGDAITDYEAAQKTGVKFVGRCLPDQASPFPEGTILIDDLTRLSEVLDL